MGKIKKIVSKHWILIVILLIASFLRLYKLSTVPVSLFGDELDAGYQAYSILKTGKDYYGNFMPIHFRSLAEWRTPLYLYSAVPTVAAFGITPLGVRLPAAIFGILGVLAMYLFVRQVRLYSKLEIRNSSLEIIAGFLLAISPWHIQYSRAGFEVTLLLFLLLLGLYFFFRSFHNSKFIIHSSICFALTPWVYSTAKLFTPLLLLFLLLVWWKEIFKLSKKYLAFSFLALVIVGAPIALSTFFGGGGQRFGYISVFTNPVTETEVGTARLNDARMRGELGEGLHPTLLDRVIHNKYTFWGKNILDNYFRAFSTDFLFVKGDINLRHSIGIGEFYKIEALALIIGLALFFVGFKDKKVKILMAFWILAGAIPAAITRDGGQHATRLILVLPPLIFLIAYGVLNILKMFPLKFWKFVILGLFGIWILEFGNYLHAYYVHYPWESERWWHSGFGESIQLIKSIDKDYDQVIISTANEPPWVFFAGWYEYPPDKWQKEFPIGNDVELAGFGKVSHIDKFYFGSPGSDIGIYGLGRIIDNKTLYLAVAKEMGANLILEPQRTPENLKLIKAVAYPSGEPAFYLFSGR